MHTGLQSFAKVKSALSQVNLTPKVCVCVCVMTSYCVLCYVYNYSSMTRDLVKRIHHYVNYININQENQMGSSNVL